MLAPQCKGEHAANYCLAAPGWDDNGRAAIASRPSHDVVEQDVVAILLEGSQLQSIHVNAPGRGLDAVAVAGDDGPVGGGLNDRRLRWPAPRTVFGCPGAESQAVQPSSGRSGTFGREPAG